MAYAQSGSAISGMGADFRDVDNDGRPQDSPEAGLLRRIAQKIAQGPAWPVLVVLDLQYRDRPGVDQDASGTPAAAPAVDGAG